MSVGRVKRQNKIEKWQHDAQKRRLAQQALFNAALEKKKKRDAEIRVAHERRNQADAEIYCGQGAPKNNQARLAKTEREYRAEIQRILDKLPIATPEDYWALAYDEFINGGIVEIHSYKKRSAKDNARKRHATTNELKKEVLADWRKDEIRSNREYASKAECARIWANDLKAKKALKNPQATIYGWLTRS